MILRSFLRPVPLTRPASRIVTGATQSRSFNSRKRPFRVPLIPPPTPFVPDVPTFLSLIGRGLSQHASKIPSWEALFKLSGPNLRQLGVEPARARRYLLRWRQKFRQGDYGIAGDAKSVVDGMAELRVVEIPKPKPKAIKTRSEVTADRPKTLLPATRKVVVNLPSGLSPSDVPAKALTPIKGFKIRGGHTIIGPHIEHVKGSNFSVARISVKEGLWEHKRGRKIDGGERRQAEVRAKRRSAEKNAR